MSQASKLILGTVQFGLNYGIANREGKPDREKARAILCRAADHGITMLDTAAGYGDSEKILGDIFSSDPALRRRFKVVSKISPLPEGITHEQADEIIGRSIENTLANLRADSIAGILFHREKDARFLDLCRKRKQAGLVELAGFSADAQLPPETAGADAVQVPANVFDRRFIPFPMKKPRKLAVRSVYLQGLLLMPEENIPPHLQPLLPWRKKLEAIADRTGITPAELYMRYLLSFPEIDGILTGVDNPAQLNANAALAEKGPLPADLLREILSLIPVFPEELIRPMLWGKKQRE